MKTLTVTDFFKLFPDDESCLLYLLEARYGPRESIACGKCGEIGKIRKLSNMPAYTCNCGHHIHPMVGTPFERSTTPLQKWFYAMYLFTTSRHGVPAKELQRQLGVTYKTAWRIGHEIRKYMAILDGDTPLSGTVEADETMIGGVRKGGKVMTEIIPDLKRKTLHGHIYENVKLGSILQTDELPAYRKIQGYTHRTVDHSAGEYVRGASHTNTIEGFWSQLKRSISGTHVHVSAKHMAKYLGEFEYRYNMREEAHLMFPHLLASFGIYRT